MCHHPPYQPISSTSHLHSDENMTLISLTLARTSAGLSEVTGKYCGGGYQLNIGPGNIYTSTCGHCVLGRSLQCDVGISTMC